MTSMLMNRPAVRDGEAGERSTQRVMVIAGRDEANCHAVCEVLETIGCHPVTLRECLALESETLDPRERIDRAFGRCQAAVVLLTPDDDVRLGPHLSFGPADAVHCRFETQARPDVYLGTGLAMARMPERTVLLDLGAGTEIPAADLIPVIKGDVAGWQGELSEWLQRLGFIIWPKAEWNGLGRTVCRREERLRERMSWLEVESAFETLIHNLRGWRGPDAVVGVNRGGAILAGMLAEHYDLGRAELVDVYRKSRRTAPVVSWREEPEGFGDKASPLLVIDVVRDVGELAAARDFVAEFVRQELRTATLICAAKANGHNPERERELLDYTGCTGEPRPGLRMPWG
jgi:hypoxanthine phosphoribosyltransferase